MRKFKAFTMAEAILVMTILGIIATIMITTMKPAKFRDEGYEVLAKTILGNLDTAIGQIITGKSMYNQLDAVYEAGDGNTATFSMTTTGNGGKFVDLLKEYISTARGELPAACGTGEDQFASGAETGMLFKNGACLSVKSGPVTDIKTWIPGEPTETTTGTFNYGVIYLDINGDKEPNTLGKDKYVIPLNGTGIVGG